MTSETTKVPIKSPTLQPSIRPSKRPTASPSHNPSSLSSESPTITLSPSHSPTNVASANPSSTPSSTLSAVPSTGPSVSMTPSQSPTSTLSTAPSTGPSIPASGSPSNFPSVSPSAIDSGQPTASILPSNAPSAKPSMRSEAPSKIPSMAPSMTPTSDPSMGPSTTAPTVPRDAQILPIFTLEYQLFDFDAPTEADLVEIEALTRAFLRDHVFGAIDDADALLDDFFTTSTGDETDSGALVINVSFESTAFYNPNSPTTIPMNDLIDEVVNAFTGEEMDEYLEKVQSLPNSNIFAGAIQIFLISQLESRSQRSIVSVLLAGSGTLVLILGGYGLVRYQRRKSARRQASGQFLDIISKDWTTECSTVEGDLKDAKTDAKTTNLVQSMKDHHHNPFVDSHNIWDCSEADDFLADKRSTYSRPRMHKFSDD